MTFKTISCTVLSVLSLAYSSAQDTAGIISVASVSRIEKTLAADDMMGRKAFSPAVDKAAEFIAQEFRSAGLQPLPNADGYLQKFSMVTPKFVSAAALLDDMPADQQQLIVVTTQPELSADEKSGFDTASIRTGANLFSEAGKMVHSGKNMVIWVDTSFAKLFGRLTGFKRNMFQQTTSTVFVLTDKRPARFHIEARHTISTSALANVVGMLPGKSKPGEYVIFSGHYDHLGTGKPVNGDSIYNGANDDAAGTTAVILLAKYFKALGNNERSIIFAAFTAEEAGGFGSQYFSRQLDPASVAAMFNIEMIGTESKWGKNSAYITGYEKTDMGKILEKNLEGSPFTFYPDPYTSEQLFYRSDNATLARLGVPAHTISTSKMDSEPNYHKVSDDIATLDLNNMTMVIRAIASSASSIISGKDTPTRVDSSQLR